MLLHEKLTFLHNGSMFLSHPFASLHDSFAFLHEFMKISALQCQKDLSLFVSDVWKKVSLPIPGCSPREQLPSRGLNFVGKIELDEEW